MFVSSFCGFSSSEYSHHIHGKRVKYENGKQCQTNSKTRTHKTKHSKKLKKKKKKKGKKKKKEA